MLYPVLNAKRKRYSLDGIWNFKQGEYVPGVDARPAAPAGRGVRWRRTSRPGRAPRRL